MKQRRPLTPAERKRAMSMYALVNGVLTLRKGDFRRYNDGFEVQLLGVNKGFTSRGANITATYYKVRTETASKICIYVDDALNCHVHEFRSLYDLKPSSKTKYTGGTALPSEYHATYSRLCQIHKYVFAVIQ